MSRALVTGGAGFIGQALVRRLLREGWRTTVLDNFSPQVHGSASRLPSDLDGEVELIRGDVRDPGVMQSALRRQDAVVHLAAETGTGQSMYEIARYESINMGGTATLLECLVNRGAPTVAKLVLASSRAVYGEGRYECAAHGTTYPGPRAAADIGAGRFDPACPRCGATCRPAPTDEASPLRPASFYALTKQAQEQMVLLLAPTIGISAFALRYQNVYGPGQSLRNPYTGILAIFASLARAGAEIEIFEDGNPARDFVNVEDAVEATWRCLEERRQGIDVFNVGSGEATTVAQVARDAIAYFGGESQARITGSHRAGDVRFNVADLTKARRVLGYEPRWRFADGARQFFDWVARQPSQPSAYAASLRELREKQLLRR